MKEYFLSQNSGDVEAVPKSQFGDIFLVVAPGLVGLAEKELRLKWQSISRLASEAFGLPEPKLTLESDPAGITIRGLDASIGMLLNQCLKIPTRILFRIYEFRCRDFPKLFNRVKKIDWKNILPRDFHLSIQVSAHASRLMHHKRIEQTVIQGIEAYSKQNQLNHNSELNEMMIFVRFQNDTCTMSIDTSGEFLYKRSPGKKTGEAPLRENLAAALYFQMWLQKTSQSNAQIEIVDPMTGSGTFLSEVATFWKTHNRRDFRFLLFPEQEKLKEKFLQLVNRDLDIEHLVSLQGFDESEESVRRSKDNFKKAGLEIPVEKMDLFAKEQQDNKLKADWVFVNPPYGVRLKTDEIFPFYYKQILRHLRLNWNPEMIGMIIPTSQLKKSFRVPADYKLNKKLTFLNGGLRVCFLVLQRA